MKKAFFGEGGLLPFLQRFHSPLTTNFSFFVCLGKKKKSVLHGLVGIVLVVDGSSHDASHQKQRKEAQYSQQILRSKKKN
jgi:hypothetical protein